MPSSRSNTGFRSQHLSTSLAPWLVTPLSLYKRQLGTPLSFPFLNYTHTLKYPLSISLFINLPPPPLSSYNNPSWVSSATTTISTTSTSTTRVVTSRVPADLRADPPADSRDRVALNTAVLEDPRAALVASADLRVDSRDSSRVVLVASAALEDPRVDTAVTAAATADPVVLVVLREAYV